MAIETQHLTAHAVEYGSAEYWKQESQKSLADVQRLMARIADLEKLNHDLCERVTENDEIRLHWEEIEQTRAENEQLKARLETVQATAYADSVDAGMRERRLRRALYKALANWAHFAVAFFSSFKTKDKWHKMEHKCLKKAEEYK